MPIVYRDTPSASFGTHLSKSISPCPSWTATALIVSRVSITMLAYEGNIFRRIDDVVPYEHPPAESSVPVSLGVYNKTITPIFVSCH